MILGEAQLSQHGPAAGSAPFLKQTGFDLKQAGGVVGGRPGRIASRLWPRHRWDSWGSSGIGLALTLSAGSSDPREPDPIHDLHQILITQKTTVSQRM